MNAEDSHEAKLAALIAARRDPPVTVPRWRRPITRLVRRLGRSAAGQQAHVDAALVAWLSELSAGQSAASRAVSEELERLGRWIGAVESGAAALSEQVGALRGLVAHDHGYGQAFLHEFDAGLGGRVLGFDELPAPGSGVYRGFEDLFRGSEEEIAQRQRAYVPLLHGHDPVLDVGCGRGELLELLRDAGIAAGGVDIDADMVRRCQEKGLSSVQEGDAVAALRATTPGSLGAVVAAQVIEHLPYEQLLGFLEAARTALRPQGCLLLETVNPHSAQSRKNFWIDPTHRHPLFPETVLALCHLTGYRSAFVWHPQGTGDPERDRGTQPDYTVVAHTAPGPEGSGALREQAPGAEDPDGLIGSQGVQEVDP